MVTRKNDEAVSPVIGVILMVAITVILAAVIAAFVFGMSGNIQKTKIVASTVTQQDADHIIITYNGGQDDQTFVSCDNTTKRYQEWITSNSAGVLSTTKRTDGTGKPNVGATMTLCTAQLVRIGKFRTMSLSSDFSDGGKSGNH